MITGMLAVLSLILVIGLILLVSWLFNAYNRYKLYCMLGSKSAWMAWIPFNPIPTYGMLRAVYPAGMFGLSSNAIMIIAIVGVAVNATVIPYIGVVAGFVGTICCVAMWIMYIKCIVDLCEENGAEPVVPILVYILVPLIGTGISCIILKNTLCRS